MQHNRCLLLPTQVQAAYEAIRAVAKHPKYTALKESPLKACDTWGDPSSDLLASFRPYTVTNGTVVVPITGVLLSDTDFTISGDITGYQYISAVYSRALADPEVNNMLLFINSGGGHVNECFELVDQMYSTLDQLPITTVVQGTAASAAYALASLGRRIDISSTSVVGSIGIIGGHVDESRMLNSMGITVTPLFMGDKKDDGGSTHPLSESARADEMNIIGEMYDVFVNTVARNRPTLTADAIRATQSAVYPANRAVANGFADGISDVNTVLNSFSTNQTGDVALATPVKSDPIPTPPSVTPEASAADLSAARAAGAKEATDRFAAILGSDEAKANPTLAMYLASNTNLDATVVKAALGASAPAAPAVLTVPPVAPAASAAPVAQAPVSASDNSGLDDLTRAMQANVQPQLTTQAEKVSAKPVSAMTISETIAATKAYLDNTKVK